MNIFKKLLRQSITAPVLSLLALMLAVSEAGAVAFDRTYGFAGQPNDGSFPAYGSLTASGSTLFGVTETGGTSNSGTLFMIGTNLAKPKVIHNFGGINILNSAGNPQDGAFPFGTPLLIGKNLYGTTSAGGTNHLGIIYMVGTNGTGFTVLHHFNPVNDGFQPYGSLVQLGSTLYGMTTQGGTNGASLGTIYSISTNGGNYTNLYNFSPGGAPEGSLLVLGTDLYGMTITGGSNNTGNVFVFHTDGSGYHDLHSFTGEAEDGASPYGSLVASGTTLFGMTSAGGSNNVGTVFAMNTDGSGFQILHHFDTSVNWKPYGDLTLSGNTLYGMTSDGAVSVGLGSIFQISTDGTGFTVLHGFSFPGTLTDGSTPYGSMTLVGKELYGMTTQGGSSHNAGMIFALNTTSTSVSTDKVIPTVKISSPTNSQTFGVNEIEISGSATDNVAVAYVRFQLNNGPWLNTISLNQYATWYFPILVIQPGTNILSAVAVDTSGNFSKTNTVKFVYVLDAPLTVITNGPGGISPAYNGASLQVASFYSMTAKADSGCAFVNWTDGDGNVVTNTATLHFEMASHLTYVANFKDATKPTLTVTSPKTGAKTNSENIVITGTAKDNTGISNVLISLNHSDWDEARLSNGNSNWTAQVELIQGTNSIAITALDDGGNYSTTNILSIDYIVTAPLTLKSVGSGTISPNYSNAVLNVNQSYSMKATPAKGFAFYFWNNGDTMSNNPTLDFTMSPGLIIVANFKDITPPTVTITSPKANSRYSNATINVTGTASDNVAVTDVGVRINDDWITPVGLTNWSLNGLPVSRGTNTLQAYAMDAAGNLTTNTVKFLGIFPPDWAPTNLTFSTIDVFPDSGNAVKVGFGTNAFSQTDTNGTGDSGTGNYEYQQTSTNTALLEMTFTAPPSITNNNATQQIALNFTNLNKGTYQNTGSSDSGSFAIVPSSVLLPASWANHSVAAKSSSSGGHTTTVSFKSSTTVQVTQSNSGTVQTGTYVVTPSGPDGAMVVVTFTDTADLGKVAYLQLTFSASSGGNFEVNIFLDDAITPTDSDYGPFTWH